jgi:transcriptional regulator with XRE-family HTH domain
MPREQPEFSEQLREAIRQAGRSRYRISQETGIPQGQLSRFMHDKGGLSLRSVDRLCGCLGLTITAQKQKGK